VQQLCLQLLHLQLLRLLRDRRRVTLLLQLLQQDLLMLHQQELLLLLLLLLQDPALLESNTGVVTLCKLQGLLLLLPLLQLLPKLHLRSQQGLGALPTAATAAPCAAAADASAAAAAGATAIAAPLKWCIRPKQMLVLLLLQCASMLLSTCHAPARLRNRSTPRNGHLVLLLLLTRNILLLLGRTLQLSLALRFRHKPQLLLQRLRNPPLPSTRTTKHAAHMHLIPKPLLAHRTARRAARAEPGAAAARGIAAAGTAARPAAAGG
jgi:hypothetical protein